MGNLYLTSATEQALAADSPWAGFFGKLRGRAAQAQRYALAGFPSMTLKRFRDIVQWPTLALAIVLFAGDWFTRVHYVAFRDNAYIDFTPRIVNQIWLLLLVATFVFGIVSLPRVPSFLALLSVIWVLFISIQGH